MTRFDIKHVASAALDQVGAVLDRWVPNGIHKGVEYVALNPVRADSHKGSFSVNRNTGAWADFAADNMGGDLVSLIAYLDGVNNGEAAQRLATFLGLTDPVISQAPATVNRKSNVPSKDDWIPLFPIPLEAIPSCPTSFPKKGKPTAVWEYLSDNGLLLMKVMRFDENNAGQRSKDYRPLVYCRHTSGKNAWRWMQPKDQRPLYGLNRLAMHPKSTVLITEGEKACDAAANLFPNFVCTTWSGGSKALAKSNFKPLSGRKVVLWPDNDAPGIECMNKLAKQLQSIGCEVSLINLKALGDDWTEKADAADAQSLELSANRLSELLANGELVSPVLLNQNAIKTKATITTPRYCKNGYVVTAKGVFFKAQGDDGDNPPQRICDRLDVLALTRDALGRNWGTLVRFIDPDGASKDLNLPSELLATEGGAEILRQLMGLGLKVETGSQPRRRFMQYLQTANPPDRYTLVNRLGWHGQAYMMPNCTLGIPMEPLHFYSNNPDLNKMKTCGDLTLWREQVAALCVNNSRLIFSVAAAFAGPLLHITGMETTGLHFVGDSSQGKTTLLKVAASVYGGPSFVRAWRSTDNALESIAAAHSDGLLILDEISQCDSRVVGDIAYMLGNGKGKARANDRGGARGNEYEWRLVFLSSGERTLEAQMAEAGKKSKAGQEIRFMSMPSDAGKGLGIFEDLHGFAGGKALSMHLVEQAARNYGTPIHAFIEKLCASDHEKLASRIKTEFINFSQDVAYDASGQVHRAADKFALVGFAGEMATQAGITGWPKGAALAAAKELFQAWVIMRGGVRNLEDQQALSTLRLYFEMHGESNFTRWDRDDYTADDHQVRTLKRCGFRKTLQDANALEGKPCSETVYYVFTEVWKSEICSGFNERKVKQLLGECGALERDAQGGYTVPTRIPGGGRAPTRMVVIRPHLIGKESDEDINFGNQQAA